MKRWKWITLVVVLGAILTLPNAKTVAQDPAAIPTPQIDSSDPIGAIIGGVVAILGVLMGGGYWFWRAKGGGATTDPLTAWEDRDVQLVLDHAKVVREGMELIVLYIKTTQDRERQATDLELRELRLKLEQRDHEIKKLIDKSKGG